MDSYSAYNQILMFPPDLVKTTFITTDGMFCNKVMTFRLKYVGATYQRMMTRILEPLLGKMIKAYIDDMLVKSQSKDQHIAHLQEAFSLMRQHRLKPNPVKCTFRVSFEKFLGHLVTKRGIEVCPARALAVVQSSAPKSIKHLSVHGQFDSAKSVYLQIIRLTMTTLLGIDRSKEHGLGCRVQSCLGRNQV